MTPEEHQSTDLDRPAEQPDLDLVAAALRADLTDISAFVESLATRLELTLPGMVEIKRAKAGFRGPKVVSDITVQAGGDRLELKRQGGIIQTSRCRVSGGITIKTETIDVDTWLQAISAAVAEQAQRSERTRLALQQLVLDQ